MMRRSALFSTNTLSIVLAHWNNDTRVDMSVHTDTSFWLWDNQSLLFLLNAACLAENNNANVIVFGSIRPGLEPTIEHVNHCATDAVHIFLKIRCKGIWEEEDDVHKYISVFAFFVTLSILMSSWPSCHFVVCNIVLYVLPWS